MRGKYLVKGLAVLTVSAATFGMATTLGVTSQGFGAGDVTVAACDADGIATEMVPAWDAVDNRYEIGSVRLSGIADACNAKAAKVTLTSAAGSALHEATGTIAVDSGAGDTDHVLALGTPLSATSVAGLHVTIAG